MPLRRQRCCTPLAWAATPSAGIAALGRHLVGGRRRLARALPLLAAAPVGDRGATPCDLAAGSRHLWPGRGRYLRPQSPLL
ncbi:hypothetical protein BHE74_00053775 [Ensete ventricosum]|nr:hypothetical protein BHE74_00053775 [Ensete ventricosum]